MNKGEELYKMLKDLYTGNISLKKYRQIIDETDLVLKDSEFLSLLAGMLGIHNQADYHDKYFDDTVALPYFSFEVFNILVNIQSVGDTYRYPLIQVLNWVTMVVYSMDCGDKQNLKFTFCIPYADYLWNTKYHILHEALILLLDKGIAQIYSFAITNLQACQANNNTIGYQEVIIAVWGNIVKVVNAIYSCRK